MEAITIAGLAVVVVGGYFAVLDFMADLGITVRKQRHARNESFSIGNRICSNQPRIKKMAGVHI